MRSLLFLLLLSPLFCFGQSQAPYLGNWQDASLPGSFVYANPYNEVWGVTVNGIEIGVIGTTMGTHFIDLSDPANPVEYPNTFIPGAAQGGSIIHRDYHDHDGFLYIVCDEGNSTLQVADISDLPNSVSIVYEDNDLIRTSHNVFIDTTNTLLYSCGTFSSTNTSARSLRVFDITDPTAPSQVGNFSNSTTPSIPYVHDITVRDNIGYLNCGPDGFYVVDFTNMASPAILGILDTYTGQGYNHSGYLDESGDYYYLADETHGTPIKIIDVSDPTDLMVIGTFDAGSVDANSIPHNLLVDCDKLYISYYYDGMQVYDISDPTAPVHEYTYDTYPGANDVSYRGNWGVFSYFPSGRVLASDMQTGLYIFDDMGGSACHLSSSVANPNANAQLSIFPQPFTREMQVQLSSDESQDITLSLYGIDGKLLRVFEPRTILKGENQFVLETPSDISEGVYLLTITGSTFHATQKIIKAK